MAVFKIDHISIGGVAACVPEQRSRTADYTRISEADRKLFETGTGIVERRVAPESVCTSDMCFAAAQRLLAETGTDASEIDLLVFVSQSPDYFLPATSILLQERLGLSKRTMAFDINLGCSGYVYGLAVASNLLSLPGFRKGLLLCGDKSSFSAAYTDKSTHPLFGDAGTATLIEHHPGAAPLYFNLQTDGGGWESIIIRGGGTRNRFTEDSLKKVKIEEGIERSACDLELNGIEVFNFSLREVKPNVEELLRFSGKSLEEIDYVLMHQANKLINESVRKKLKLEKEKVPYSIDRFGNTSSASIPLTLVTELGATLRHARKELLLSGFGVGYSWGSVLLSADRLVVPELIELK